MGLRDIIEKDVKNVFLNPDEFGEAHIVDGRKMTVIIDDNGLAERRKRDKAMAEGLHTKQRLFYVSAEEYGSAPLIGRLMELDGDYYTVADVTEESGMYAVSLEANES